MNLRQQLLYGKGLIKKLENFGTPLEKSFTDKEKNIDRKKNSKTF